MPRHNSRHLARNTPSTPPSSKRKRNKWVRRAKLALCLLLVFVSIGVVSASLYAKRQLDWAAGVVPELPEKMVVLSAEPTLILDRNGTVLETIQTEFRKPVRLKDVPDKVIKATLAAEDKRFYNHQGVDYWAMGRAFVTTATGKRVEGASTITMQIAKRVFTNSEKTLDRKAQDIALAIMIEQKLTKEQILELYLNQIYYGSGAYGISAAAEVYFGKKLDDLSVGEAAMLARCVRRPSQDNPFADQETALRNRTIVLDIMRDEGWVSQTEFEKFKKEPLKLNKTRKESSKERLAPYFCDYVRAYIKDKFPDLDLSKGGYRIETTLDWKLQKVSEQNVRQMVAQNRHLRITTSAFVLLDNEGRVLAMVGGPDYKKNQFNVITQGRRQPGSSFKPLVYATAFEVGALHPGGSVSNAPYLIPTDNGRGKRYVKGGGKGGSVSIRTAIASSINTPAMWACKEAGVENVVQMAHQAFGIKSELPVVESIALGADEVTPLEMAVAYSVFQSGGDRVEPFGVAKIIGPDGVPLLINHPNPARRQLSAASAQGIDACLRAVVTGGTGRAASPVTNARGKTGTTSDNKDAWFCGYTDKYIGVGWVANATVEKNGRVRYAPMDDYVMGGHLVAPMWKRILQKAQDLYGEDARKMNGVRDIGTTEDSEPDVTNATNEPSEEPAVVDDSSPTIPEPGTGEDTAPDAAGGNTAQPEEPLKAPSQDDGGAQVVFVEICADSGARASIYCPERVRRAFRSGKEPKGRCRIHHA